MDNIVRLFARMSKSGDGIDLLAYLKTLSLENYEAFKKDEANTNDIHKGYAIAIDNLIKLFETASDTLARIEKTGKVSETGHY